MLGSPGPQNVAIAPFGAGVDSGVVGAEIVGVRRNDVPLFGCSELGGADGTRLDVGTVYRTGDDVGLVPDRIVMAGNGRRSHLAVGTDHIKSAGGRRSRQGEQRHEGGRDVRDR